MLPARPSLEGFLAPIVQVVFFGCRVGTMVTAMAAVQKAAAAQTPQRRLKQAPNTDATSTRKQAPITHAFENPSARLPLRSGTSPKTPGARKTSPDGAKTDPGLRFANPPVMEVGVPVGE